MKIKTGPETARRFGCGCPRPDPRRYSEVFPSSSKHLQSNSGQHPTSEKESREKTPSNAPLQPYAVRTHEDDARGEPTGGTVSTSQVIAILPGAARPAPLRSGPPSRWQDSHWEDGAEGGPRRGREAGCREVPEREEAVLGAQCRPLGHSASPPGRDPESGGRPLQPHTGGGGGQGPSCAAAVATSQGGHQAKTEQVPRPSLARQHKAKNGQRKRVTLFFPKKAF